jgi:glucose-6-phosphate dehydrogenase assembly protein OpcA
MAPAVSTRSRPSPPEAIEDTLTALWREAGQAAPLAHALLSNLVVVRQRAPREPPDLALTAGGLPLEAVVRQHPCRLIVIHHAPGTTAQQTPIAASANLMCFESPTARFGVEAIAIGSSCDEASLPSIVRRLTIGDVPTTVWWSDDLSGLAPMEAIADMARQIVYDSRAWRSVRTGVTAATALLGRAGEPDLADLNWRRLDPIRQALTQAASPAFHPHGIATARIVVRHRPGGAALAWLLVGWLDSRIDSRTPASTAVVEEMRRGDEILEVEVGGEGPDVTATMNGHRVRVKFRNHSAPLVVTVPHETMPDVVAAELRSLEPDRCLHETLRALADRFAATAG